MAGVPSPPELWTSTGLWHAKNRNAQTSEALGCRQHVKPHKGSTEKPLSTGSVLDAPKVGGRCLMKCLVNLLLLKLFYLRYMITVSQYLRAYHREGGIL